MKFMFASDIHGSYPACSQMLKVFEQEKAEKLFLLGDLLYHGPRNDLPQGYLPKQVIRLLNENADKLFCVRGNCDTEVDQMVLEFPILSDYSMLFLENRTIFLSHGHIYNPEKLPKIKKGDILINGHTHVQKIDTSNDIIYINVGSVSLPKENNEKSYMIYEDGVFTIKQLYSGETEYEFKL